MQPQTTFAERQHKKTTSSVLKAIMTPRNYQHQQATVLQPIDMIGENRRPNAHAAWSKESMLPPNQPPSRQQSQDESRKRENMKPSPTKPVDVYEDKSQVPGFHKKTKSSVSLKSLMRNEKVNTPKPKSPKKQEIPKPKKSKSSTSLSALLSRPKSSRDLKADMVHQQKDKENMTPPMTADLVAPPIWAQFAHQPMQKSSNAIKIPLNDARDVDKEMALYSPPEYSPTKQRNFHDYQKPSLSRPGEPKPRPRSAFLPSGISTSSFAETLSGLRKQGHERGQSRSSNPSEPQRKSGESNRKPSFDDWRSNRGETSENRKVSDNSSNSGMTIAKRGSRVMAVVAAFNGKSKEPHKDVAETKMDVKAIENAFESLLVRR